MFPKLLRPFDYLRIKHEIKDRYDFIYPGIISFVLTISFFYLPVTPQIFGQEGLITSVVSTIQILTGFYIASLAAIATFNKDGLDDVMRGTPPTLAATKQGRTIKVPLTRRKFLCLLFGYLALLSILINLISICAKLIYPSLLSLGIGSDYYLLAKVAFVFTYFFILSNLFVTTLLGLYYMSDRIHRNDTKLISSGTQSDNPNAGD